MNKVIAIKPLWELLCYLCYLIFQSDDSGCRLFQILWILHLRPLLFEAQYRTPDTHLCQLQTFFYPDESLYIQSCIRTKPSKHIPIQLGCYQPSCQWLLSFSQYLGYLMKKLTSFFTRGNGKLHSTGFSTSPLTMVLEGGKAHNSTSRQSADRLDNLSCVRISEWKYIFRVTYV